MLFAVAAEIGDSEGGRRAKSISETPCQVRPWGSRCGRASLG